MIVQLFSGPYVHTVRSDLFTTSEIFWPAVMTGKNFFAFKLSELAVPSRFQSFTPSNSQVSLKMVSCQQHGVPDQLLQYTKLHSTVGSMDSEPTVDSTCTNEHVKWVGISGVGEGGSETRSNVVECSAVNQSRTSSPSAEKSATGSMM